MQNIDKQETAEWTGRIQAMIRNPELYIIIKIKVKSKVGFIIFYTFVSR